MTTVAPSTALKLAKGTFVREAQAPMPETDLVPIVAEVEDSDHLSEDYAWVGEAPRMQLLEDELRIEDLSDAQYSITNNTYAIGIEIRRRDLRTDRLGILMRRVKGMVRVARRHSNRLLIDALIAGTTDLGFDGSAIFANAHADRGAGATQDNLLAGSGPTVANLQTDINAGLAELAEFLGENGEPVNDGLGTVVIVAPWGLRSSILTALNATVISQTSNVGFEDMDIRPVFSSRLTDADDWYMLHVGGSHKPLIYQQLDGLTFETLAEGSDQWVKQEKATFKVRWDGAVGWGHWANAVKFVN